MREFCVLVFLGLNSWMDIKRREISLVLATMLAATGMIWTVYRGTVSIDRLLPIMTGVSFLGISVITRGAMGMGDGWILLALGTVLMPEELRGIVKCANPKCITNNEPMTTLFHVIDKEHGILKCHYCEKEQSKEGIKLL